MDGVSFVCTMDAGLNQGLGCYCLFRRCIPLHAVKFRNDQKLDLWASFLANTEHMTGWQVWDWVRIFGHNVQAWVVSMERFESRQGLSKSKAISLETSRKHELFTKMSLEHHPWPQVAQSRFKHQKSDKNVSCLSTFWNRVFQLIWHFVGICHLEPASLH